MLRTPLQIITIQQTQVKSAVHDSGGLHYISPPRCLRMTDGHVIQTLQKLPNEIRFQINISGIIWILVGIAFLFVL